MRECRRLKPVLVGQFEFVEWTPDGHLRHRYMGLVESLGPWMWFGSRICRANKDILRA
jgi:hypothetical protein